MSASRREFLRTAALALGAAACSSARGRAGASGAMASAAPGASGSAAERHIGIQLYTLRALTEHDLGGTLDALARIGYREVEFAGYQGHAAAEVRAMLDHAGLTAPSAHIPLETLRSDMPGVLAAAATVGHQYIICPYANFKTIAEWERLADDFNGFGRTCREHGLQFGYHNHDQEFHPIDGRLPYDVLLTRADPSLVKMELDIFWATKAGQDPVALFARAPGRFPLVHVKDMRGLNGPQTMVDVGAGDIDFRRIFAHAAEGGVSHYIVEHDQPADPLATARASYVALSRLLA